MTKDKIQEQNNGLFRVLKSLQRKPSRFLVIDLGDNSVEMISVEVHGHHCKVLAYAQRKMNALEVEESNAFVTFVHDFVKQNQVKAHDVVVSLSDDDVAVTKYLNLPAQLPARELLTSAKWQLKNKLPLALEKLKLGWQIINTFSDAQGVNQNQVMFVAIQHSVIDSVLALLEKCQLSPFLLTWGPYNFTYLLKNLGLIKPVVAVLEIGDNSSNLNICAGERLLLTRKLPVSWEKMVLSLTEKLVSEQGVIQLSREEAEKILCTFGIPAEGNVFIKNNLQASHVLSLIRPHLEILVREIKITLNHFTSNFNFDAPEKFLITGQSVNLKDLDVYLKKELSVPVEVLSLPPGVTLNLKENKSSEPEKIPSGLIKAVGAALNDGKTVNFLPEDVIKRKAVLIQNIALRLTGFALATVLLFMLFLARFQVEDYEERLKTTQKHFQTISAIKKLSQEVSTRQNLLEKVYYTRIPVDGVLRLISSAVPDNVTLEYLSLDTGKNTLNFTGTILASEEIADERLTGFIRDLEGAIFFKDVSLVSSNRIEGRQEFEISCELVKEEGSKDVSVKR